MTLLIDNYDSFCYNLYQLLGAFDSDLRVVRNDELALSEIEALRPNLIVLSPGPGKPENAGICVEAVKHFAGKIPIFGVCLGHQAIAIAFGAKVGYAKTIMHGKISQITLDTKSRLFRGFSPQTIVARYHSLAIAESSLPTELKAIAHSDDGEIMAIEHTKYALFGVQFHPESVMTNEGKKMIENIYKGVQCIQN